MVALASGADKALRDKKRIGTLDGIRGLCAMTVVVTHVAFSTFVLPSAAGDPTEGFWSILAAGQVGAIGPFFIMSGLFLYRPFVRSAMTGRAKPELGQFFARRVARLLPAFWLLTAFSMLVLNYNSIDGVWYVLRPFLMLHVYDFQWYAGLDVAWTVPTETQFYLALPLLAMLGNRLARGVDDPAAKARRMLMPLGVLVVIQFAWTAYVHGSYDMWPPQYFYPFGILGLLAIGMAMAIWSVLHEVAPEKAPRFYNLALKRPNLFWLGALAVYAINCAQPFSVPGTADWLSPEAALVRSALLLAFSFLIMVPLIVPGATSRLMEVTLDNAPMRFLGRISYGLYLWHFAVMYMVFESGSVFGQTIPVQMLLGKFGFWELVIPTVIGTIAVSAFSYYLFERPVINFTERHYKAKREKKALAESVAAAGSHKVERAGV